MKKFVYRSLFFSLVSLLLFFALHEVVPARTSEGSPNTIIVVEEHPWDLLRKAVKIHVLLITDDIVILLVWFEWDEPPVIVQMSRGEYDGGLYEKGRRLRSNFPSISRE